MEKSPGLKKRFVTQWNFTEKPTMLEYNTMPSLTVPDLSMSIKDILLKFSRGADPMLTKNGKYEFENNEIEALDQDEFDMSDLTSIDDAQNELLAMEEQKTAINKWIAEQKAEKEIIQPTA
jgi:hypothetical protein